MRRILLNTLSVVRVLTEKAMGPTHAKTSRSHSPFGIFLGFIFVFFLSTTVFADHFKGAYYTYKYLGGGKYEFIVKGYWDKHNVANLYPRYRGGASFGFPVTLSKTLLPDGETVEHVQKQIVTWSKPGMYEIYYDPCCMGTGSNYDGNPIGMSTTVNYSPTFANSSPQFYDYPLFNFPSGQAINYKIDMKDPEGHEQEYSLVIPSGLSADAYKKMTDTGFQFLKDGSILWENPVVGTWLVQMRLKEKIGGNYTGVYLDRIIILTVVSTEINKPASFTSIEKKVVRVGQALSFEVDATDTEGETLILNAYGIPMELGAGFSQTTQGSAAKGVFSWPASPTSPGTYRVQFVATDNQSSPISSRMSVDINVVECTSFSTTYNIASQPCPGSNNGKITLSATAGYSPFKYSLDNGVNFQESAEFQNLAAGTYTAIIKDAIGCTSGQLDIVLEEEALPEITLNLPSSTCSNSAPLALTGNPAGGIFEGAGIENGFFYPSIVGVGTHSVSYNYSTANGCSISTSQVITVNSAPIADAGADTEVYTNGKNRNCTTLYGNASDGIGPYTFAWSTGETTQNIQVCPLETTTYLLTVTDQKGCSNTSEVTVTVWDVRDGNPHSNRPEWAGQRPENPGKSDPNWGVVAEQTTEGITVFPNPVNDYSQLLVTVSEADEIKVDIIDYSNTVVQKLYSGKVGENQTIAFELKKLKKNAYYLARVITGKNVYFYRLLME